MKKKQSTLRSLRFDHGAVPAGKSPGNFRLSIRAFWPAVIVQALMSGCMPEANYAPVTVNSQPTFRNDAGKRSGEQRIPAVQNKPAAGKENHMIGRNDSEDKQKVRRRYTVKDGETLYSIGVRSGFGYERLAQWNRLRPPYRVVAGQQLKFFDEEKIALKNQMFVAKKNKGERPEQSGFSLNTEKKSIAKPFLVKEEAQKKLAVIDKNQQKKSIISINNKKVLKLNFAWPIKGRISRNFNQANRKGIDIAGKIGQKVHAAEAGTIAYSGEGLLGFGNLIIIKHNDLYLSAYGNNSRLLVREGEQVEKGQAIAQVGNALSKKAALHFEIRKNGKPVNPLKLLPKSDKAL